MFYNKTEYLLPPERCVHFVQKQIVTFRVVQDIVLEEFALESDNRKHFVFVLVFLFKERKLVVDYCL